MNLKIHNSKSIITRPSEPVLGNYEADKSYESKIQNRAKPQRLLPQLCNLTNMKENAL
jgi:hypothetical protein